MGLKPRVALMEPSPATAALNETGTYFALALIVASGEAFAGSPAPYNGSASTVITTVAQPFARDCFIAAGGLAAAYNRRCESIGFNQRFFCSASESGHRITTTWRRGGKIHERGGEVGLE
jgi:hypothetical protein